MIIEPAANVVNSFFLSVTKLNKPSASVCFSGERKIIFGKMKSIHGQKIEENPFIKLVRKPVRDLEEIEKLRGEYGADYVVLASGPLTSESLAKSLSAIVGSEYCYFYEIGRAHV